MESKQKTILDLCRELPDAAAEAELRARARDFNLEVERVVIVPTAWRARDYMSNIADAKAATDAVIARIGVWFICGFDGARWRVKLHSEEDGWEAEVAASTEQLARAACALLATEAMREEIR